MRKTLFSRTNNEFNKTRGRLSRRKRFIFALLFSAIMGGIVENDMKSCFDNHLKTYNRILNDKIRGLASEMNNGFDQIKDRLWEVRQAQSQLECQIHMLAIATEDFHRAQENKNRIQNAINRQFMQQTIANTRAILENRKLALLEGHEDAKRALLDFHLHGRILMMMGDLKPVRDLMNYTVYETNIRQGLIENKAL